MDELSWIMTKLSYDLGKTNPYFYSKEDYEVIQKMYKQMLRIRKLQRILNKSQKS